MLKFIKFLISIFLFSTFILVNSYYEKVEDVLKLGQVVKVKLMGIDEKGRLSLSMKEVNK